MAMCFVYATVVLGQPTGLSEEVSLYAGTDWLGSAVSQRVAIGQLRLLGKCAAGAFGSPQLVCYKRGSTFHC